MNISTEQEYTLELFKQGKNVLILGPGGTGKTYIIKSISQICEKSNRRLHIAAMTGKAASLIPGARTLHSTLAIGLGKNTADEYIEKIRGSKWYTSNWKRIKTLVIDEISMLGMLLLDKIDKIARAILNPNRPFGGIQVIGSGDFLQLPPIKDQYCFKSINFDLVFPNKVIFKHNFRQDNIEFCKALSEVRIGKPSPETIELFESRLNRNWQDDGIHVEPVRIFPLRRDVEKWNWTKMQELKTEEFNSDYKWIPCPTWNKMKSEMELKEMLNNVLIETNLVMKVGASVMYIINNPIIDKHNGSTGVIIDKDSKTGAPVVKFTDGSIHTIGPHTWLTHDELGALTQIPLIIAFAQSVHKSQGAEFDCAILDIGENIFEFNQIYVALSRIRTLQGVYLLAFDPESIRAHPDALDFYHNISNPKSEDDLKSEECPQ
jgi:ATP-dependent DNA helicase PIF1